MRRSLDGFPWDTLGLCLLFLGLPLTTWIGLIPGPRTPAQINDAVTATPTLLFLLGGLAVVAIGVGRQDRWLGLGVGWTLLNVWRLPTSNALQMGALVTLGAVALTKIRTLPRGWHPWIRWGLVGLGLLQIGYAGGQRLGWDPLWGTTQTVHGTIGNPNWLGVYLGILTPVVPLPLLPLFAGGLWLSHSRLGVLAAAVGLLWRIPSRVGRVAGGLMALGLVGGLSLGRVGGPFLFGTTQLDSWGWGELSLYYRGLVWGWAGWDWLTTAPLLGLGPGAWYWRVPALQLTHGNQMVELFAQAHSDVLQVVYELGVVGGLCLAGWIWAHRSAWHRATPWAGTVGALTVTSLGMFPFHVPHVAALGCLVLALATSTAPQEAEP